ncbi:Multidrug resistance protein MdtC [Pirellula sp. SH-Sr6A]|uniref:efflux RND transporter permease subunit n=1 Tax=Pirellula sp. SH-Sr6A TaxID=1632865 RepID=UPI00078D8313|nr:efflux RND transporter permease subunit [Pirellula sp. SH-Sr6A]AMV31091.1 Multidrug resistance protein MdtC [Pirellula sp. SH-Sr6A]
MYWLAEICVKRPVFALMLVMALVVAGIVAFPSLGIDRYPSTDLPTVFIRTNYPGAASQEVESEVSQIVEDAVSTVAGIEELRSISNDGSSICIITFALSRDIDAALQDVRDAVSAVSNRLPDTVDPPVVQKSDIDSSPIMTIAVSGERTPTELYFLADRYVKSVIESSKGVGQVSISGAAERAIKVNVDAKRLAAYEMSILQVREALVRQNTEVPGGRVDEGLRERSLRTLGRVEAAKDFPELVVDTIDGVPIRLKDLGTVEDSTKEVRTIARLDGVPTVTLSVQRQSGENTVNVIAGVKERLERSRGLLPSDVNVTVIQDQSRYILAALHEIENHLISGSILACLTVLLFMRSWRSTLIASVAIPASIIATFAFMKAFGFTLNNVTMLALVLMVGVVIDDAIVVLENVFRCIEELGMDAKQAAIEGTKEIGLAVLATTVSLVIVFLPVSFLSSVTGRMLFEFGVTATVAILVSMFISFTLTPMMCSLLLKSPTKEERAKLKSHAQGTRGGFYHWIEVGYMATLKLAMRYRFATLILCVLTILANIPLYGWVRQDYIPTNVDESEFEVSINAKEGTTIVAMNSAVERIEKMLQSIPGVELTLTSVGSRGFGGVNSANIYVRLVDAEKRSFSLHRLWKELLRGQPKSAFEGNYSQQEKMAEIRGLLKSFPDVRLSLRNLTSLRQGPNVDIDFTITGPDAKGLATFSEKVRAAVMSNVDGVVDVDTTLRLDKPEMLVDIDRERAAAMGVSVQEIADTLRVAVGGDDRVSRYRDASVDDAYDVELRLVGVDRQDTDSISQLYVRTNPAAVSMISREPNAPSTEGSTRVPLTRIENLVNFQFADSQARIDRLDRQRMVAIRANLSQGYALADRINAIKREADAIGVPPGFETRVMGRGRELDRTLGEFRWTFLLSFVFMYIVLAAQFEHLAHPLTILFTLPLSVPFGLISLYWGNETLNVYSALGVLVLFGVVKKAAILQIDCTNALRHKGMDRESAILIANRDRLRPILMTTISFVAGLLPLLIATGPGAEERRSIAVLATGGQTLSLLLTLLAVPVLYSYLDDLDGPFRKWFRKGKSLDVENAPTSLPNPEASSPNTGASLQNAG